MHKKDIVIENAFMRLVVGSDCLVRSLIYKGNGEECLTEGVLVPLVSLTQERPFNNEIKLAYPCKRTTFAGNRLRREGDTLIVGFALLSYEARIEIREAEAYIGFVLSGFDQYEEPLTMDGPPVASFRLLQLPLKKRESFGAWLNVSWDRKVAINLLAAAPETLVHTEGYGESQLMLAEVYQELQLQGTPVALIVNSPEHLLDSIAVVEEDYDLPRGVESRRRGELNASIYRVSHLTPKNVEEHIRLAKKGGFRLMEACYTCFFEELYCYELTGNYDYNADYPHGKEDLRRVLDQIKAEGIIPGLHFLHTHIGLKSRYCTPVADHRLRLKRQYTLARPLGKSDTVIYVEQNPAHAVLHEKCRILQFGGELISYQSFCTQKPYCFTGCVRGYNDTIVSEHATGVIGGILDVSEYGGCSVYMDQDSSLTDEVYDKLAEVYNLGFRFVYFDGSEGTNLPYEYYIPKAQLSVYRKMDPPPLFCEGAARAHFSWHMLSGGNAFDCFMPSVFKEMLKKHPAAEAPRMRQDFTRLNFGWWYYYGDMIQPDMYEYGTSRAAAWDCPITLIAEPQILYDSPRYEDVLEVLRRWELARATNWLTEAQKEALKDLEQEHMLLINEEQALELVEYARIGQNRADTEPQVTVYHFTRLGGNYLVYWYHKGEATLHIPLDPSDITLLEELYEEPCPLLVEDGAVCLPAGKRRYIKSKLPASVLAEAMEHARLQTNDI